MPLNFNAMDEKPLFTTSEIDDLNGQFELAAPEELLRWSYETFGQDVALGTGFGSSGVVLLHMVHAENLPLTVFCLDTNLLFNETYALWKQIEIRYGMNIESVAADLSLSEQAKIYGNTLWKTDPDTCCTIRKVKPLQRYLSGKKAWISGIRQLQSPLRKETRKVEWDPVNRVLKLNPLADWSDERIRSVISRHNIPYNPLHDEGYPSIGCVPCTVAAANPEDERSGRWVHFEKTECGIHLPVLNRS